MKTKELEGDLTPAQLITNQIGGLKDWRGEILARLRSLILESVPGITEEWKWDTAVWSQKGNVVSASAFNDYVKPHFFKGASIEDPAGLFNAGLESKAMRAIDFIQGDPVPVKALQDLLRRAAALDLVGGKK